MKIQSLSIRLVTHEKRRIIVEDTDAVLEDEEELVAEYTIKLKEPKIIPSFDLVIEDGEEPLLPGSVYMFESGLQVVAVSNKIAKAVDNRTYKASEFKIDIYGKMVAIAQTWKES